MNLPAKPLCANGNSDVEEHEPAEFVMQKTGKIFWVFCMVTAWIVGTIIVMYLIGSKVIRLDQQVLADRDAIG